MPHPSTLRRLAPAGLLALLAGCAQTPETPLPSGTCPGGPVEAAALEYLNAGREQAALAPLIVDPALAAAAEAHADYLARYRQNSHYQEADRAHFTGRLPGDRARAAGYPNRSVAEVISPYRRDSGRATTLRSLEDLMAGPYHRLRLLDPTRDEIGAACRQRAQRAYVYLLGNRDMPRANPEAPPLIVWPADGTTDIPPLFFAEAPDPLPEHAFSGYPVSVSFNPAHFRTAPADVRLRLYEADSGRAVPVLRQLDAASDPNGLLTEHQFVLFPAERLEWGRDYRVELTYGSDDRQHHAWTFRTREPDVPMHRITDVGHRIDAEAGHPFLLFVPPGEGASINDVAQGESVMSYRAKTYRSLRLDAVFVDPHVLRVTAEGEGSGEIEFAGTRVRIVL